MRGERVDFFTNFDATNFSTNDSQKTGHLFGTPPLRCSERTYVGESHEAVVGDVARPGLRAHVKQLDPCEVGTIVLEL